MEEGCRRSKTSLSSPRRRPEGARRRRDSTAVSVGRCSQSLLEICPGVLCENASLRPGVAKPAPPQDWDAGVGQLGASPEGFQALLRCFHSTLKGLWGPGAQTVRYKVQTGRRTVGVHSLRP